MKIVNPTGRKGEDLATDYLKKIGYRILERNFRLGYGEVDIVAIDNSEKEPVLAFVEVKTRTTNTFGTPFEAITRSKLQSIIKTAAVYVQWHKDLPALMRIDGVSVILNPDMSVDTIEVLKNIS